MVERPITGPTPHRSGRAELPHPALQLYIHSCRFYLHVPDNKTSTFVPLSSDIQFPAQLNLNMTNWNSVFMRYPALHVRRMFLSQFKYNCQLLRHVQGFPLLRLLWADLTSKGSSLASLFTKHPYHILWNTFGSLKFSIHLYIHATTWKLRWLATTWPIRLLCMDFDGVVNLVSQI